MSKQDTKTQPAPGTRWTLTDKEKGLAVRMSQGDAAFRAVKGSTELVADTLIKFSEMHGLKEYMDAPGGVDLSKVSPENAARMETMTAVGMAMMAARQKARAAYMQVHSEFWDAFCEARGLSPKLPFTLNNIAMEVEVGTSDMNSGDEESSVGKAAL